MKVTINPTLLAGVALIGAAALGLGGCGKKGLLDQPAPLFGERARQDYDAQRAGVGAAKAGAAATRPTPAADQPDPNADNAPVTSRDLKSPEQNNTPASQDPIAGVPDLTGPPPSMKPPGR
jgi:hypothetical protein